MTSKSLFKAFKFLAIALLASALLAGALLAGVGGIAYFVWAKTHSAPLKDLSAGTLPRTFQTRSPKLQAKLKELESRRLLPNQYPPAEFEPASRRLWESFAETLSADPFEKLVEGLDAFEEFRASEPRYAEWPDAATTPEQMESLLRFLKFDLQDKRILDAFKEDAPFQKAEEFVESISKVAIPCRRPTDLEAEPTDLMDICKLKFYIALAEGRRPFALHMLDTMFKLARSPLLPGVEGESLRDEAAICAVSMLKTNGWSERELKALLRIVDREAAAPFMHERILTAERLAALSTFENARECGKGAEAMSILQDFKTYYDDYGVTFFAPQGSDIIAALTRDIDEEELLELELIDALSRKGMLQDFEKEEFVDALPRKAPLSSSEDGLVKNYAHSRSHADASLLALSESLKSALGEQRRKAVKNPLTGEADIKCQKTGEGFEADINPQDSEKAFAPSPPPRVENQVRKI